LRKSGTNTRDKVAVANKVQEISEYMNANAKKNKQTRQQYLRFRKGTQHIAEKKEFEVASPKVELVINPSAVSIPALKVSDRNQTGL
jgi:hypothetical protein